MRIGLFTDEYLPRKSGVSTSVHTLKKNLEQLGHEVYVIAPNFPGYEDREKNVIRVASVRFPFVHEARFALPLSGRGRRLQKLNFDIIHSHTAHSIGLLADRLSKKTGVPHITTVHTVWAGVVRYYPTIWSLCIGPIVLWYSWHYKKIDKLYFPRLGKMNRPKDEIIRSIKKQVWQSQNIFLNEADIVTSPSRHLGEDLIRYGLKKPLEIIPNGVDAKIIETPIKKPKQNGKLNVLGVGRMSHEKHQDLLIRATAMSQCAELTLVGHGPQFLKYKKLAEELKVDHRVNFVGGQDYESVKKYLAEADVFALASYKFDNQPMVLIEASRASLPIVYCDSNLGEMLSPKGSVLCESRPKSFADAFDKLHKSDRKSLLKMGQANRDFSNKFESSVVAEKFEELYQRRATRD